MNEMQTWRGLEDRRSQVEAVRENSTRAGRSWATYNTTGIGYSVEENVFRFGSNFLDEPIFTFGFTLNPAGPDLPTDDPPRCTAGVYEWTRTGAGLYSGAYCWFVVDSFTDVIDVRITYTLAWEGIASKDFISTAGFPVDQLDI